MGLVASSSPSMPTQKATSPPSSSNRGGEDENNGDCGGGGGTSSSARAKRKSKKVEEARARKQKVDDFVSKVLDESFLSYPVRASTIEAAEMYDGTDSSGGADDRRRKRQQCLMPGTHKHLGGAYDPTDGCIYGVPANSRSVLCLYHRHYSVVENDVVPGEENDVSSSAYGMKTIPLPADAADRQFKWLRGIFADGYMWAIPSWADSVLCVDVDAYWGRRERRRAAGTESTGNDGENDGIVQLLPLPDEHPKGLRWQWHGAGINRDKTAIYCIPSNARKVLKVDIVNRTTSLIDVEYDPRRYPDVDLDATNKWYGGIRGEDDCVYGYVNLLSSIAFWLYGSSISPHSRLSFSNNHRIPYRASAVLRIDCATDTATLVGPDYGPAKFFWHGGIQVNGKIYAHPSHADTILVIDTNPGERRDDVDRCCYELPIHRAEYDTDATAKYRWLGGSLGADGNIYCPPCDHSAVLRIDTKTDQCSTFGFTGTDKNKWQGGVLSARDGCVYCIPANGRHVARIATTSSSTDDDYYAVQLIGDLPATKDKWQGGHVGRDGCLYFINENGYRILKVVPPDSPPNVVDGRLPEDGGVRLEFL